MSIVSSSVRMEMMHATSCSNRLVYPSVASANIAASATPLSTIAARMRLMASSMSNCRFRGERFDGAGSVVGMRTGPRNFGAPAAFARPATTYKSAKPAHVSGGAHPGEQGWQGLDDALVPFPQERGEDV